MITMSELVDLRMQQHIAQEIYRQQIMQRIPDPFHPMLPMSMMPHHVVMPPRPTLPDVDAKLENNDLWKKFHQIGTEMIITKTGRRMFPSMRVSLSGLEDESNYCVLLEMVPIGDCRYKFSGSQWVPAGGAEPQSPQRMFLHPDSPATGAHWQTQAILFNKVKLTNNTLDNSGQIVLASMHKYQPRLHVIRTSDLTQIPWAPQQAFVFPETEFVAVTAYQNDRITKLKIDNNPFAKGFRESGQSRCKRKMSTSPTLDDAQDQRQSHQQNDSTLQTLSDDDRTSISSYDSPQIKRMRSNGSVCSLSSFDEGNTTTTTPMRPYENGSPKMLYDPQQPPAHLYMQPIETNPALRPTFADLAYTYFARPQPIYPGNFVAQSLQQQQQQFLLERPDVEYAEYPSSSPASSVDYECVDTFVDVESTATDEQKVADVAPISDPDTPVVVVPVKRNSFSISAILGNRNVVSV